MMHALPTSLPQQVRVEVPPPVPVPVPPVPGTLFDDPSAVLEAYRNQRRELRDQLERLVSQREDLVQENQQSQLKGTKVMPGLEQRITLLDQRILELDRAIAEADNAVARAAAVPGAVVPPPPMPRDFGPPEEFWVLTGIFILAVLMPLAIGYARRIWRRGAATAVAIPQEIWERFSRLDQAVDSIAIEVERVGEGQRFLTRVYQEKQRELAAGAEPVAAEARERQQLER